MTVLRRGGEVKSEDGGIQMFARQLAVALLGLFSVSPALANCENGHDLCVFAVNCMANHDDYYTNISSKYIPANNGQAIWGVLAACVPQQHKLEDYGSRSCLPGDYVAVAVQAIGVRNGNQNACNAFH